MFITFRNWTLLNTYEDDDIFIGRMVKASSDDINVIAEEIRTSPMLEGGAKTFSSRFPQTVLIFKKKGAETPQVEISESKISQMEGSISQYRYNRTDQENKRASVCERLRGALDKKKSEVVGYDRLNELFTIGVLYNDIFMFADGTLVDLSKPGKVTRQEVGQNLIIDWECAPNNASSVLFINKYEIIKLLSFDPDRFKNNLEEINKRTNSKMRIAPDYFVAPANDDDYYVNTNKNLIDIRTIPAMTVDEMVYWFNADRRGTKLETFVSAIRHLADCGSSAYFAVQEFVGKQFLFEISSGNSLTCRKVMSLDSTLMLSSYCRIIASSEDDNGNVKLIGEVTGSQSDDIANVLYSFMEKTKRDVRLSCVDSENFNTMITHFMASNVETKQ